MNATSPISTMRFPVEPIAAVLVAALIGYVAFHFLSDMFDSKVPEQATAFAFRPTKSQLEGLKIRTVENLRFHGEQSGAPSVLEAAILHQRDKPRVFVLNSDGTIALRKIVTGRSSGGMVEAVSGLQTGEQVVSAGAPFIVRAFEEN